MPTRFFIFKNQHLLQSLSLLVGLAISLNINSCACKDKNDASSSWDKEDTHPKIEIPNPITLALTSVNGCQLTGNTPLVLIIKNTGKQPIIPKT